MKQFGYYCKPEHVCLHEDCSIGYLYETVWVLLQAGAPQKHSTLYSYNYVYIG